MRMLLAVLILVPCCGFAETVSVDSSVVKKTVEAAEQHLSADGPNFRRAFLLWKQFNDPSYDPRARLPLIYDELKALYARKSDFEERALLEEEARAILATKDTDGFVRFRSAIELRDEARANVQYHFDRCRRILHDVDGIPESALGPLCKEALSFSAQFDEKSKIPFEKRAAPPKPKSPPAVVAVVLMKSGESINALTLIDSGTEYVIKCEDKKMRTIKKDDVEKLEKKD